MKIIRMKEAVERVGMCRSRIYQLLALKAFPAPIKLGERAIGFFEHEIDEWLSNRPRAK